MVLRWCLFILMIFPFQLDFDFNERIFQLNICWRGENLKISFFLLLVLAFQSGFDLFLFSCLVIVDRPTCWIARPTDRPADRPADRSTKPTCQAKGRRGLRLFVGLLEFDILPFSPHLNWNLNIFLFQTSRHKCIFHLNISFFFLSQQ